MLLIEHTHKIDFVLAITSHHDHDDKLALNKDCKSNTPDDRGDASYTEYVK